MTALILAHADLLKWLAIALACIGGGALAIVGFYAKWLAGSD